MNTRLLSSVLILLLFSATTFALEKRGADIPWITYEAEHMNTDGTILGPQFRPFQVETESSGQKCVKLNANGQSVEFTATEESNSMIIRFSLPDGNEGKGTKSSLSVFVNEKMQQSLRLSSGYTMLYGKYPFTNEHEAGEPRNYYDEVRIAGLKLEKGDVIKIQRDDREGDDAEYCILDLVDLEKLEVPIIPPPNSLSITDQKFVGFVAGGDFTEALRKCIAEATASGKTVWIPEGTYQISGDIVIPSNAKIPRSGIFG